MLDEFPERRRAIVFVERLWKSVKCGHVFLLAFETPSAAWTKLAVHLDFQDRRRRHSSLDRQAPITCTSTSHFGWAGYVRLRACGASPVAARGAWRKDEEIAA